MTQIVTREALTYLDKSRPLPLVASVALRVAVVSAKWAEHRRTRQALADLDPHMLKDVGIDALTARQEANRKFWQ